MSDTEHHNDWPDLEDGKPIPMDGDGSDQIAMQEEEFNQEEEQDASI